MSNFITNLILFSSLLAMVTGQAGLDSNTNLDWPKKKNNLSIGIELTAKAAIVRDEKSGAILFEKNKDLILPIASLTKLMTAVVLLDNNLDWEKVVTIDKEDLRDGNVPYLIAGEQVQVKDLFNIMLVGSINEAAAALVRQSVFTYEEFIFKMNEKAKSLKMTATNFVEPTGLDARNRSTVADISVLAKAVFNHKEITTATNQKSYQFSIVNKKIKRTVYTTNQLLDSFLNNGSPYTINGAKTGYLVESLYTLAIKVSGKSQPIIIVILGSQTAQDRWQEAKGLVEWVYENYTWVD